MSSILAALLLVGSAATPAEPDAPAGFPKPQPPPDSANAGAKIQRTMTLLATSTPQKRNRVRILFYGQSITASDWSRSLAGALDKAYPHADLQIENRAIGGFTAPALVHTAEFDLYPFYPDLVIFHAYSKDQGPLEEIIARTRKRTTSEILMWTSLPRWFAGLPRDASPDHPAVRRTSEADERHAEMIRQVAAKHGCELVDVRRQIETYLADNGLHPPDLLTDGLHPNELGNFLLESLIAPHLRHDSRFSKDTWKDLAREYPIDAPEVKHGPDGQLELSFEGNRIDVIAAAGEDGEDGIPSVGRANAPPNGRGTADVRIDGRLPSEFPELYAISRPSPCCGAWWPAIVRPPDRRESLAAETWTARFTKIDHRLKRFHFDLTGSQTGRDGSGTNSRTFVSDSGRVVLEPGHWRMAFSDRRSGEPLPDGFEVTWNVVPMFVDVYRPPKAADPSLEYATTLAQGLSNSRHTLAITPRADGPIPIRAFRVYRPPLR